MRGKDEKTSKKAWKKCCEKKFTNDWKMMSFSSQSPTESTRCSTSTLKRDKSSKTRPFPWPLREISNFL